MEDNDKCRAKFDRNVLVGEIYSYEKKEGYVVFEGGFVDDCEIYQLDLPRWAFSQKDWDAIQSLEEGWNYHLLWNPDARAEIWRDLTPLKERKKRWKEIGKEARQMSKSFNYDSWIMYVWRNHVDRYVLLNLLIKGEEGVWPFTYYRKMVYWWRGNCYQIKEKFNYQKLLRLLP